MEISITWNICRVCLVEESKNPKGSRAEQMRNIFGENDNNMLPQHIYAFSGIIMKPDDNLPKKICQKCLIMVNNAVYFRKTCRSSNTYLQSILQRTQSATSLFKPERPPIKYDDDNENLLCYDDNIKEETESIIPEEKDIKEHSEIVKRKGQPLMGHSKRIKSYSSCDMEQTTKQETNENSNDLVANDEDLEVNDNVVDNSADMDEIIEHSEEMMDEMFASEAEDNVDKKVNSEHNKDESKFFISAVDEPEDDVAKTEETNLRHIKSDDEDLYCTDDTQENQNLNDEDDGVRDHIVMDDRADVEFFAVDEQTVIRLEHEIEDNQPQVTSTVVTNEEIDLQEQNSNSTIDFDTEYEVAEYFNDDSNSSISSQHSTVGTRNKKFVKSLTISRKNTILPRNKGKAKNAKSSAASSTGGSHPQVCFCEICGNQFTNRHLMNIHMKVHRQEKNHECELCFKRFITACNLQAHMRIHTGEKPFECQYCGRRFSDRSSNLRHERTHTNEKPFQCKNCGKSFTLATTLQNHMKVHTGERSFRCEPCNKSFKLPHHLKTHQNTTLHKAAQQLEQIDN